ncbi:hypothetical protein [Pseudomonas nitroreducens]|uniref:hypothetical protein n=1 Tax=Pseudomonas nitroreducens TaxID=46680 RepID=UPI0020A01D1B|nr:hypothetical protein [Pseudomonas nitroreducens]MCP1624740.1 hypothetical protein [Pseudomonas nitroreducens]
MSTQAETLWNQLCADAGVDPQQRMAARQAILADSSALDATVYRPDDNDPDAEEQDMGDAKVLFLGPFDPPTEWDAAEREDFFDDADPALFFSVRIECEAQPGTSAFFVPEVGDYLAVMDGGKIQMYFLHDWREDEDGCTCVLIRDDIEL